MKRHYSTVLIYLHADNHILTVPQTYCFTKVLILLEQPRLFYWEAVRRLEANSVTQPWRSSIPAFFVGIRRRRRCRCCCSVHCRSLGSGTTSQWPPRSGAVTVHGVTDDWIDNGNTWHATSTSCRSFVLQSLKSRFFRLQKLGVYVMDYRSNM